MNFTHLHVHSNYSILDGMSKVPELVEKARRSGMNAIALTDHGNMYGIKELLDYVNKLNKKPKKQVEECEAELAKVITEAKQSSAETESQQLKRTSLEAELQQLKAKAEAYIPFKPIVGVETYCARRTLFDKDKDVRAVNPESGKTYIVDRSGNHLILLAKNKKGYQNLCKMVSQAFVDGFYDRPRIDKNLLTQYHEGIIACSACLAGEVPQLVMAGKIDEAEQAINWYKNLFGEDYYIEIQRHQTDKPNAETSTYQRQKEVNPILIDLARKTNTKIIATNDVHFVEEFHAEAHDRLICLSTGKNLQDTDRLHYTKQEWLKTPEEMARIFADVPEALANTQEIVDKIEFYSIDSDPIMPVFPIPESFGTEADYRQKFTEQDLFDEFTRNEKGEIVLSQEEAEKKIKKLGGYNRLYRIKLEADYLAKLTWEGAQKRYGDNITDEQRERIIFELHIMKTMGFPGYFLIVQDYIRVAREELGVSVGPGRGSAAGSVVAYCLWITDIDPLKYDLLFERFLNPDRISLPDIDVDFDDDGRFKVIDWVTQKYGKERVAHIITYGTMATKSSIADVGRVQQVPLSQVNEIKGFIPEKFPDNVKDEKGKSPKVNLKNCLKYLPALKEILNGTNKNLATMLEYAEQLEGTVRQVGIHACGLIIGADDLTNFAPLSVVKDRATGEDALVTEYDGHVVESVGLIKMDFLGLSTLSIIKEALANIKKTKNLDINIDTIPIDDAETYQLFCKGQTVGVFQFESSGMQKYLRELQPSVFEDLIAMNALYRPGPMDYIPQFIARKHGKEPIVYDIPVMEKYLKDTYGVTVYQEQVMLLSRLLANFTRGEADTLRKAMGKKLLPVLAQLKPKFLQNGKANGHDTKVLEKIWADWEKFASYAFNKSHATCYSWVAYQTAYLKAHFPAEFMAANLTRSKDDIGEVGKLMDECKNLSISVLEPDVNESDLNFMVNEKGDIRFGLGGIKGVGENAVLTILEERKKNGKFKGIFDFVERINLSACNRKTLESLALSGAFDSFSDMYREQLFVDNSKGEPVMETIIRYGNKFQADAAMSRNSLFGGMDAIEITKPEMPGVPQWSSLERLNKEKSLIGMYISAHPLDEYEFEISYICNTNTTQLTDLSALEGKKMKIGGILTKVWHGTSQRGNPYGKFTLEDYEGSYEFALVGKNYIEYSKYMIENLYLLVTATVQVKGADRRTADSTSGMRELEIKIERMDAFNEVRNSLVQKLTIQLPIEHINEFLLMELTWKLEECKGNVPLYFTIYDESHQNVVTLRSKSHNVTINKKFFQYLKEQKKEGIFGFKIN